ncbi:carbohydrate ABC transporter permease [Serratia sp. DD3]|uniref:carbohydrate ABC transporter permease n=1 Tax=Serratia sp. DD3 TaxID=1410619 RepID=UPI0003C4E9A9|nr:sugar ABC transporter permease [Serratia sp. DD3]
MRNMFFVAPLMLPVIVFWLFPFICSIYVSFTDWDYISPSYHFVGLENYTSMMDDGDFSDALINTVIFSLGTVLPTTLLGLFLALLLRDKIMGGNFYRAVIFSPWITPTVAVSIVWTWVFSSKNGLVNSLLSLMGFSPIAWLEQGNSAMFVVIVVTVWQSVGWTMLFYINALGKIPDSLYEASMIDGCSKMTRLLRITLPLISPTTFFLIIINLINSLAAFDQFQMLTQGGPSGKTRTLFYLYFQQAFERYDMGPAAATSLVIVIITATLVMINAYIGKRWVYY